MYWNNYHPETFALKLTNCNEVEIYVQRVKEAIIVCRAQYTRGLVTITTLLVVLGCVLWYKTKR